MSGRKYRVKEVARRSGVTVRTLHHYDAIGLLCPSSRTDAGYRLYDEQDLLRLQQILVARELDLPLEQIRRLLDDPQLDRRRLLVSQREELTRRLRANEAMLRSIDAALAALEGETMNTEELFGGFDPAAHEAEVKKRWGKTDAYAESARRTGEYTPADWKRIQAEHDGLLDELAEHLKAGRPADGPEAIAVAEGLRLHIDRWYYPCTPMRHVMLSQMYVADARFRERYEARADGLTEYLAAAIRANAARP